MAYTLSRDKERRSRVVVNDREGPEYDMVGHPVLSADGAVVAYRAERDDEWIIRVGDREEPAYDFVTDPAISADGASVAYAASQDGRWFLIAGGVKRPLTALPAMVFISADGRQVGWVDRDFLPDGGSKMRVAVPGKIGEPFGLVGYPVFSPTEPLVAYGAEEGGRRFVVIGTRKIETPDRIGDPAFSPDGRRVGYGARIGREIWWKVLEVPSNR